MPFPCSFIRSPNGTQPMKETLHSQLCDVLDEYVRGEIHIGDCSSLCEEVALKFANNYAAWIQANHWVLIEYKWTNVSTQQRITPKELIEKYQEFVLLNQSAT